MVENVDRFGASAVICGGSGKVDESVFKHGVNDARIRAASGPVGDCHEFAHGKLDLIVQGRAFHWFKGVTGG